MTEAGLSPGQALRECLDAVLGDIQARLILPDDQPQQNDQRGVGPLFGILVAASRFMTDRQSAGLCEALCRDWQAMSTDTGGSKRPLLRGVLQCREAMQAVSAQVLLQHVLIDQIRAAVDGLTVTQVRDAGDVEPVWAQEALARCAAINAAARFLAGRICDSLHMPSPEPRSLLHWLLSLERVLTPDSYDAGVSSAFRRAFERCAQLCGGPAPEDGLSRPLWQLQLLAGALPVLDLMSVDRDHRPQFQRRSLILFACVAQAQYPCNSIDGIDSVALRQVIRQALLAASAGDETRSTTVAVQLTGLPETALKPAQDVLAMIPVDDGLRADWTGVSLSLYRLLLCLRMLAGGFTDVRISDVQRQALVCWQWLAASLYASTNHCVQKSVVTGEDRRCLLGLLHRLPPLLQKEPDYQDEHLLPSALLLAARLGLRAHRHWQQLTFELDAAQQDFAGVSVQQVLAAGLHCLPGMGAGHDRAVPGTSAHAVLPDLRLLLKGARILNVPRIESLVLVMIEMYQQIQDNPAFAETSDISKVLLRAHRSLCRMLDQAAVWRAPGNARRVISSLYGCLERWRGDVGVAAARPVAGVNERPQNYRNDAWQVCLTNTRRLRKLVRHQDDLDSIRALLLELLRSQEDFIRQQADYGTALDASRG